MTVTPLFCDVAMAERIERAEAQLMDAAGRAAHQRAGDPHGFTRDIGGGVAIFAGPGSPFNKIAGLGFGGLPSGAELDDVEQAFAAAGSPVQAEVATLADPAVGELLTGRGYRLVSFENVLGRVVGDAPTTPNGIGAQPSPDEEADEVSGLPRPNEEPGEISARPRPNEKAGGNSSGIEVRLSSDAAADEWFALMADAVADVDTQGQPAHEDFPRQIVVDALHDMVAAGCRRYEARRDGVLAGGGSMRVAGRVAQLTGAATSLAHRRRGAQTALLAARLADAAGAGCDIAVVATQPGSKSQQNVQRAGFHLLYTRAVLVKGTPSSV